MLKFEQMQLTEATIISYKTENSTGKMVLKKDHEDFEKTKVRTMFQLVQNNCEILNCEDILYSSEENLQEYLIA